MHAAWGRASGQWHTVCRDVTDLSVVEDCAERVNVAGPRLLSLERPACKICHGWQLETWRLGWFRPFPGKSGRLYPNCGNSMVYVAHLRCFWKPGIWAHSKAEVWMWPAPNKNPGHRVFKRTSLVDSVSHMSSQVIAGGMHVLCESTGRVESVELSLRLVSFGLCPLHLSLCSLCFYPCAVRNFS